MQLSMTVHLLVGEKIILLLLENLIELENKTFKYVHIHTGTRNTSESINPIQRLRLNAAVEIASYVLTEFLPVQ